MDEKEKWFGYFIAQLKCATANIDSKCFKLSTAGHEEQIFRERVYCYELYHQLRCNLANGFPYNINGELDKKGHLFIKGEFKPDFIVHVSGTMENNLAVIEVKQINSKDGEIKEDINKFKDFLDNKYYRAIMLIYGDNENKVKYAQKEINNLPEHSEHILLLWHKEYGSKAEEYQNARTA